MIVFVDIIQISMFYNDISYSHWFPDVHDTLIPGGIMIWRCVATMRNHFALLEDFALPSL